MPFSDPVLAGSILVRQAIQSPDYVTTQSGWAIKADGSAEFSDLYIRGAAGHSIHGYVDVTDIPVLDFNPATPSTPGWTVAAGSIYVYPDSVPASYQILGISSPVQNQPAATGQALVELRSGMATDPTSAVLLTADMIGIYGPGGAVGHLVHGSTGLYYLRGQTGVAAVTLSGAPTGSQAVTFPKAFEATPQVHVNFNTVSAQTSRCTVRATNITTTGFNIFAESSASAVNLAWVNASIGWTALLTV